MNLEELKTTITLMSAVVIPVVLAYLGNRYTKALKEREVQAQFVKIAVDILQAQPTQDNRNVRDWATQIISRYSGIPLSPNAQKDLIENIPMTAMDLGMKFNADQPVREITKVQEDLRTLGFYKGEATGTVDQATVAAIIELQKAKGAFADGVLGPQTRALIKESVADMKST